MPTYKAVILTEDPPIVFEKSDALLSHEELCKALEPPPVLNPHITDDAIEQAFSDTVFEMMRYLIGIKEEVEMLGYMNMFGYKDVSDICQKCLRLEPLQNDDSDDEGYDDEDIGYASL